MRSLLAATTLLVLGCSSAAGRDAPTADAGVASEIAAPPVDAVAKPGPCDDHNACTFDQADPGGCIHAELPCYDGDPCTQDVCTPAGGCQFLAVYTCDDGDFCTDDVCQHGYGCTHNPHVCASDGNVCTKDVCKSGKCQAIAVSDGGACEAGLCAAGVCTAKNDCPGGPWQRLVGGKQNGGADSLAVLPDGTWLSAGSTSAANQPNTAATWLVHITAQGKLLSKSAIAPGTGTSRILALPGGDVILAGSIDSPPSYTRWLARATPDGQLLWQWSVPASGAWGTLNSVVLADDQLLASGWAGGEKTSGWLGRFSLSGQLLSESLPPGEARDVAVPPSGGVVLAGRLISNGSVEGAWLARLDMAGSILWQKTLGGPNGDYFQRVLALPDGGLLLLGETNGGKGSPGSSGAWLVRTDGAGNVLWMQTGSQPFASGYSLAATDGGFVIAGRNNSYPKSLGWLWRVDAQGQTAWQRTLPGPSSQFLATVRPLPDGHLALAGTISSEPGSDVSAWTSDVFLARTDAFGHLDCSAPCTTLANCDDGDPCTADSCEAPAGCQHAASPAGCSGG